MRLFDSIRTGIASLFGSSQTSVEMDTELRSHIQHRADDLERGGLTRKEAERRARIEFGGYVHYKEDSQAALGGSFAEGLVQDIRFSLRKLRKSPGFTLAAVLTLALAIGANAVVFSVLNALILRPLNVPQPQSLYQIQHGNEASGYTSYPDYLDLRDRNHSFEALAAWTVSQAGLDTGDNPSQVWAAELTGNYFDALAIQPYLGRVFHASDEHGVNSAPYIVLTYAYWHSHFQGDRGVVGRVVRLNKHPFTILGVAPPEFRGTILFFNPDVFVPLIDHPMFGADVLGADDDFNARSDHWVFQVMGHLKPGVTPAQGVADLNSIGSYLAKTYPKEERSTTFALVRPNLYGDYLGKPVRAFMAALMLLSGLILLAACANLGSLFAARAADGARELALRLALGSSRKRILRGLFTEALLISLGGGALGLTGSILLLSALSTWEPISRWPIHLAVNSDASVYAVALLLALASGFLFGAVPVRQVLRTNPYEIVKSGSHGNRGRRITLRDVLLVLQIAICAVLVTSSMVALRGLARSLHANFGFTMENTILANTGLEMAGYTDEQAPAMQKRMTEAVQAIPGVESVGLADTVPLGDSPSGLGVFTDSTTDLKPSNAVFTASRYRVSPEYFHTAGTALLLGRPFTWHDEKNSPRVAVVNGEFARRIFGSAGKAVGGFFKLPDATRVQVVGVAEDGKYESLTEDPQPVMFIPILQVPVSDTWMVVHSKPKSTAGLNIADSDASMAAAIRSTIRSLDPALPVFIQTRYEALDANLFGPRMATFSLGVLGILGAMLSITGIFGMAAYSVSMRLRELGIRVALGAQHREVLQAALGRPLKLLAFGSAAGLILGLLATRVLASIVYQATPRDPLVLGGVVLAMMLLGLIATWIPAMRALSVDPMILLREE